MFQMKWQFKSPEKHKQKKPNEMKVNHLPDEEFKAIVIRLLTELGERIDEHSENYNKDLENFLKNPVRPE